MVNWSDPAEIQRDAQIFARLQHAMLGIYAWEFFITLDFDFAFLTGKKQFKWPMIFYFANRYLLLGALAGILIGFDTESELNCQALYTFNQLAGNAAAGLASINLSIRTMAIWQHNKFVDGALILVILGHWSLILQGVNIKAQWMDGQGCVITHTSVKVLSATFIYTMIFDLLVLLLNAFKLTSLSLRKSTMSQVPQSRLSKLLFRDGLIYFLIAFLSNLLATVFMLLNWNPIMSVFFNVPAVLSSTIVACRAVRRLMNFGSQPVEVYGTSATNTSDPTGGGAFRPGPTARNNASILPLQSFKANQNGGPGVHVQMETFTKAEDTPEKDVSYIDGLRPDPYALSGMPSLPRGHHGHARDPDSDVSDADLESAKHAPF